MVVVVVVVDDVLVRLVRQYPRAAPSNAAFVYALVVVAVVVGVGVETKGAPRLVEVAAAAAAAAVVDLAVVLPRVVENVLML